MSGRRLLDAARLLNASKSIAKQHIQLRSNQLDIYSKTSTLAKATKDQTDRVTLTVQAAVALAQRFNENTPKPSYSYETAYPPPKQAANQDAPIPRQESVPGSSEGPDATREGLEQDHHYQPSEDNATAQSPPEGELSIRQEESKQDPLPDGTIPPAGAQLRDDIFEQGQPSKGDLAAGEARQHQRRAEAQIPAVTATGPSSAVAADGLASGHDQEVFYDRPTEGNFDYSSLPRAKIPKHVEDQQGAGKVDNEGINSDTYYSPGTGRKSTTGDREEDQVPPGVDINVFRTARVSRQLGVDKSHTLATNQTQLSSSNIAGATASSQPDENLKPTLEDKSADAMRDFAKDLAKDVASESPVRLLVLS